MEKRFKEIIIDPSQKNSLAAKRVKSFCSTTEEVSGTSIISDYRQGKKTLSITPKKGKALDRCATINSEYVCCNVHVLKSVKNCPFDCSYCFLQNYLNDGTTQVVGDNQALLDEVIELTQSQPQRIFRIGTWELGDSLALEKITGQAEELIKGFSKIPNAILELKTKSDCVDNILNLDHQQKTVVSWSMNPHYIIHQQEHRTASLENRLKAIKKCADAGYLLGIHFDPMIYYDQWEKDYVDLVDQETTVFCW